ncbi:hypothetical protein ACFL2I_08115 [Candidatus Omnitrophota bacterium]
MAKKGKDLSKDREFGVILEDLSSQFRTFGEGLEFVRADVGELKEEVRGTREQVGRNFEDITIIKVSNKEIQREIAGIRADLKNVKTDIEKLAQMVADNSLAIKALSDMLRKQDFQALEKRIATLEKKVETILSR